MDFSLLIYFTFGLYAVFSVLRFIVVINAVSTPRTVSLDLDQGSG